MTKRISAFLLSVVLCLGLVGTAFAADEAVITEIVPSASGLTISGTGLPNTTYPLCSIEQNGEVKAVFDIKTDGTGKFSELFVAASQLVTGDITISIPNKSGALAGHKDQYITVPTWGGPSAGGGGGGGGANSYSVSVNAVQNGSITVSPRNAVKGQKVTITVKPNNGYVLDSLTVRDANKNAIELTKVDDSTYTFIMPATRVTIDATFKRADGSDDKSFSDVPSSYTFYEDITWVANKGYMQGYDDGTFRPNNNTTRQALWMVLGRIDGANPSSMSTARTWAMNSNVSDGTTPAGAMSRQQMVTMLYRYAQLKGYSTAGGVDISSYPDANGVASYARDAISWAVGNGIVQGTTAGTLNPEGTASRAHFAAFLHRFCNSAGIA